MIVSVNRWFLMAALMTLPGAPLHAMQRGSPFAQEVPTAYPKFDANGGSLALVVAELVSTESLQGFDCPRARDRADHTTPVEVCLNPPPTWFKARVVQHVAGIGIGIGDEFHAVTGSHYGAMKIGATEPARLMLLNSNGTALEMMRYKSYPVSRSRDAQLYLVLQAGPVPWLPCWTAALMEEIDDSRFDKTLAITREEYDSRRAQRYADFYRVTADSARPRYAIPIARLEEQFRNVPLAHADFSCAKPASGR